MIVNALKVEQAIVACNLHGTLQVLTRSYKVKLARIKLANSGMLKKKAEHILRSNMKVGVVIDILDEESSQQC